MEEGALAVMIEDDEETAMMRDILKRVEMELPPLPPKRSLHNNNGYSLVNTVSSHKAKTYNNIVEPDEEVVTMMMMLPPPPPPPHIKLLDRRCMDSVITHLDSTSIDSMSKTCKFFRDACAAAEVTPVIESRSKRTEANASASAEKRKAVPVNDAPLDELSVQEEEEVDNRSSQDVQDDAIQSLVNLNLDILPSSSSFDAPLDELRPHTPSPPRNNVVGMSRVDNNPAVTPPSNQDPAPSFDESYEKNCINVSSDDSYDNTTIGTDDDHYNYQQQQLDDTFSLEYSDDDEHYASEQSEVDVEGPSTVEPTSFYTLDSPTKRSGECEESLEEPTTVGKRLSVNSLKAIHNTTGEYTPCTPPKETTTVKRLSVNSLKAISNTMRENTPCTPPKEAVPFTPLRSNGTNTPSTTQSSTCSDEHDSNQDYDSCPDDEVDDVHPADVDDDSEEEDIEGFDETEEETSNSGALLVSSLADFIGGVSGLATDVVSIFAGDVRRNGIDDYGPIKIGDKLYSQNEALQMWKKAKANMDLEGTYGEVDYSGNDKFETTTFFERSVMYSEKTAKMEKKLARLEQMSLDGEPEESTPKKQGSSVIMAKTNGAGKVRNLETTSFFEKSSLYQESTAKMDLKLAPRLGEKIWNDELTRQPSSKRGMSVKQVADENVDRLGTENKNEKMTPLEKDSKVDGKLASIEHKSRNEEPQSFTPRSRGRGMSMTQAKVLRFLQEDAVVASSLERRSRSSPEVSKEEIDTDTATSGSTVSSTYPSSVSYTSSEVDLEPAQLPRVKRQPMPQASLSNEDGKSVAIDSVMGSNYGVEVSSHCCKFVSKDDSQTIKDVGGYKESEVVAPEPIIAPKSMSPQRVVSSRKPRVLAKHGMGITSTKRRNSKTVKEEKKKSNLSLKKFIKKK